MQQMRTLGGAKEEEVAGAPVPELLRRLIGLCRVKVSIKDVHFRYENLAQGDMEVEAGTSAHAAGAVLGRLDLVQDENSSLSGVGTLDLQVADLGAYLKPASHGGADHSASDLELAVGDPRSRRASAQREQEERARASSCSSEASEAACDCACSWTSLRRRNSKKRWNLAMERPGKPKSRGGGPPATAATGTMVASRRARSRKGAE